MSPNHDARNSIRLHYRLDPETHERLRHRAAALGLTDGACARRFIVSGLAGEDEYRERNDSIGLAALVAVEHVRLLLQVIVPDGERRTRASREAAASEAELRLQEIRALLGHEDSG